MSKGEIMEIGRHDELIAKRAFYHSLVQAQELKTKNGKEEEEEGEEIKDEEMEINVENEKKLMDLRKSTTKASIAFSMEIKDESAKEAKQAAPFKRILKLQRPEYLLMAAGTIGATINGIYLFILFA